MTDAELWQQYFIAELRCDLDPVNAALIADRALAEFKARFERIDDGPCLIGDPLWRPRASA